MKKLCFFLLLGTRVLAQDSQGYQTPPQALNDLLLAPPTPGVSITSKGDWMLISERAALPTIDDLSQPELRLAGLRINPATNGPSRQPFLSNLKLRKVAANSPEIAIKGLPANARISSVQWSPDESKIAFLNTADQKIELYVVDVPTATATKVTDRALNAAFGSAYGWRSDSKSFVAKLIPENRGAAPEASRVPSGPTVQENLGRKAAAPTYQDLLKSPSDERQFTYYATSQAAILGLDGSMKPIGPVGLINSVEPSPDARYVLLETTHTPFSYLVPAGRFPNKVDVYTAEGTLVKTIADTPLADNVPYSPDGVPSGPRNHGWRADAPATVYWVEARDGGDPRRKVAIRDEVLTLEAPFTAEPKSLYKAANRFGGIIWGNATTALVNERWYTTRKVVTKVLNPSNPDSPVDLFDRSSEDRYNNPGQPELKKNAYGRYVLDLTPANEVYMTGLGSSPEGDRPFVDVLNLTTKQTRRLWRSEGEVFENVVSILDAAKGLILTTRETPDEAPNYFIRKLNPKKKEPALTQLTAFAHPYPQMKGVQKQVLRYKRPDGVDLTATLYLPAGYKKEDGPLPTFLWAYPAEFKSRDAAGQRSGSPYQFNRISYWGAAPWVTQGYAILDNASIPIVGEGDKEPNDTYVEQLVASAKAAIDEGVRMGVVDSTRVGVGGHSYGAFMTANLLSHSKLFRAGIARSGAYNRTLTPFGFQNEARTYWQAPEVYNVMSPFMNADKMKTPLLLIHGEADNNTGTYPIQSERYFNALKGMGATARLVFLPYESHGYAAKESLQHMLWEMNNWLDTYVKKASKPAATGNAAGKVGGER